MTFHIKYIWTFSNIFLLISSRIIIGEKTPCYFNILLFLKMFFIVYHMIILFINFCKMFPTYVPKITLCYVLVGSILCLYQGNTFFKLCLYLYQFALYILYNYSITIFTLIVNLSISPLSFIKFWFYNLNPYY